LGGWIELGQALPGGGGGLDGGGAAGGLGVVGVVGGGGLEGGGAADAAGVAGVAVLGIAWYSIQAPYAMSPAPIALPRTAIR
jgi:hypothetical protein